VAGCGGHAELRAAEGFHGQGSGMWGSPDHGRIIELDHILGEGEGGLRGSGGTKASEGGGFLFEQGGGGGWAVARWACVERRVQRDVI